MAERTERRIFIGGPLHRQVKEVPVMESRIGDYEAFPASFTAPSEETLVPAPKLHTYWLRIYHGSTKAYKFMVHDALTDDDVMDQLIDAFLAQGEPNART